MIHPELATEIIRLALDRGATDAECTLAEGEEFSALVRMRSLEKLKDAGSRAAGLRVLVGQRVGSSYTSDLSSDGIRRMVDSAIQLAAISTEDPHAGLPDSSELGALTGNGPEALKYVSMVGNDLQLDEGVGICGKEGQSVPVGVGIPTIKLDRMTVGGTAG